MEFYTTYNMRLRRETSDMLTAASHKLNISKREIIEQGIYLFMDKHMGELDGSKSV